jgi:hypothetical protein
MPIYTSFPPPSAENLRSHRNPISLGYGYTGTGGYVKLACASNLTTIISIRVALLDRNGGEEDVAYRSYIP